MKKTSILLVDDHAVVRMGLSAIINLQADLKVPEHRQANIAFLS